jgi:hypothetical protein
MQRMEPTAGQQPPTGARHVHQTLVPALEAADTIVYALVGVVFLTKLRRRASARSVSRLIGTFRGEVRAQQRRWNSDRLCRIADDLNCVQVQKHGQSCRFRIVEGSWSTV